MIWFAFLEFKRLWGVNLNNPVLFNMLPTNFELLTFSPLQNVSMTNRIIQNNSVAQSFFQSGDYSTNLCRW